MVQINTLVALAALSSSLVHGIDLDVTSIDSIELAASTIASGVAGYYQGNETGNAVGILGGVYMWWEAGAMFDALIQYWQLTGDDQYNRIVSQGLQAQQGPNNDFMPPNQTTTEGNDDQGIWALAAMSAAESQLPDSSTVTWLKLAEAVFNEYAARWDTSTCAGGLRWQIQPYNSGYNYKDSASNGAFFQLASRLARYTGNSTYSDWASRVFDWTTSIGLIDNNWNVYDGANTPNCSDVERLQFSYNAGLYIGGAAYMYNITSGVAQTKWQGELNGLLNQTLTIFFPDGVATEIACETEGSCDTDQEAYKGLLAHYLVETIQIAPYTSSIITPKLMSTAEAAAEACTEGTSGSACPLTWSGRAGNPSAGGFGGELDALSFVQGLLVNQAAAPMTETTGGSNGTTVSGPSSGTANPTATKSAGIAMVERESIGVLAGVFSLMAWLIL